jgi:hypothetical protein
MTYKKLLANAHIKVKSHAWEAWKRSVRSLLCDMAEWQQGRLSMSLALCAGEIPVGVHQLSQSSQESDRLTASPCCCSRRGAALLAGLRNIAHLVARRRRSEALMSSSLLDTARSRRASWRSCFARAWGRARRR